MNIPGGGHHHSGNTAVLTKSARRKKLSAMDEKALDIVEARKISKMASLAKPEKYPEGPEFSSKMKEKEVDAPIAKDTSEFSSEAIIRQLEDGKGLTQEQLAPYMDASHDFAVAKQLVDELCKPVFKIASSTGRDLSHIKELMRTAILEHIDLSQLKQAHQRIKARKEVLVDRPYSAPDLETSFKGKMQLAA